MQHMQPELPARGLAAKPQEHPQDGTLQLHLLLQALHQPHGAAQSHAHPHAEEEVRVSDVRESLPPRQHPAQPPEDPQPGRGSPELPRLREEVPGQVWSEEAPLPHRAGPGRGWEPAAGPRGQVLHVSSRGPDIGSVLRHILTSCPVTRRIMVWLLCLLTNEYTCCLVQAAE